jgi:uncharacterized cofD-like protein
MREEPGLNIVCIGGGTGLSTLLSGLKAYVGPHGETTAGGLWLDSLTAVVTVTDDGGSSGRLREEFQILPPGDIRNCLAALAEDELLMTRLFQYRFESEGDLSGHSFGNLFLAALAGVTGDFLEAVKVTSEVLAIKGRIYPSTVQDVELIAELEDGRIIRGETNIVESRSRIRRVLLSHEDCRPLPETLEAIQHADLITIGPGSLYTSIVPNLLVNGIVDALQRTSALKVYVSNIMTQPGETEGFTLEDHLVVVARHGEGLQMDVALHNSTPISGPSQEKYLADGAVQVRGLKGTVKPPAGFGSVIEHDLLCERDVVRHDPAKLAALLLRIYKNYRQDRSCNA